MREDGGGSLGLDHGAGQETTPTNDVLLEELTDYVTNVGHIHLHVQNWQVYMYRVGGHKRA